jgi:hypothetical protein
VLWRASGWHGQGRGVRGGRDLEVPWATSRVTRPVLAAKLPRGLGPCSRTSEIKRYLHVKAQEQASPPNVSASFKRDAADLVPTSGRPIAEVAAVLGVVSAACPPFNRGQCPKPTAVRYIEKPANRYTTLLTLLLLSLWQLISELLPRVWSSTRRSPSPKRTSARSFPTRSGQPDGRRVARA